MKISAAYYNTTNPKTQDFLLRLQEEILLSIEFLILICYNKLESQCGSLQRRDRSMIFVSGVHGVGKSYFCNLVKESVGIETYSASALISTKMRSGFAKNKLIPDIDEHQQCLL